MIDYRAFECNFGLLGLAIPDEDDYDCRWYRYFPQLPLWEISFMDKWDWGYDYYKWTCNYLREQENEDGTWIEEGEPGNHENVIEDFDPWAEPI